MDEITEKTAVRHFYCALFFLFFVFLIQELGVLFLQASVHDWFMQLRKPSWNPPSWVFALVWPVLYLLVAFVGYLLWVSPKSYLKNISLFFWVLQLFFNAIWTYIFFTLQSPLLAFFDIILVIFCSVQVMHYGKRISKKIVYSFIPYIAWLLYAGALNLAILLMN